MHASIGIYRFCTHMPRQAKHATANTSRCSYYIDACMNIFCSVYSHVYTRIRTCTYML